MITPRISEYKTLRAEDVLNDKRFNQVEGSIRREAIHFMYNVLWMLADDQGRVDADYKEIQFAVPRESYGVDQLDDLVNLLNKLGLISVYTFDDGEKKNNLIQIISYVERQRWNGMRQALPSQCYPASDKYPDEVAVASTSGNWLEKYDYATGKLRNGDTPLASVKEVGLTPLAIVKNNKTNDSPIVSKLITNSLANSPQGGGDAGEGEDNSSENPDRWDDDKIIEEVKLLIGKRNNRKAAGVPKEHAGTILSKVREYGGRAVIAALRVYLSTDFYAKWRHTPKIFANQMEEFMVVEPEEQEHVGTMKPQITSEEFEFQRQQSEERLSARKRTMEDNKKRNQQEEEEFEEARNKGF